MCGRFTLKTPVDDWLANLFPESFGKGVWFGFTGLSNDPSRARFNIAPSQPILVLVSDESSNHIRCQEMRWGLVPSWANDLSIGYSMINARSETIAEKPSFRPSLKDKRCVILADGYYEWQKISSKEKHPHWIHRPNEEIFAMAGLWAVNQRVSLGTSNAPLLSTTIITTPSNADTASVHDRMPAILTETAQIQQWLTLENVNAETQEDLLDLLRPAPEGTFQLRRVSSEVGKPQNEYASLIEPFSG